MKYVLCVDTQPQLNPSEDIRKYIIEIEELRKKDDVYDTLVINNEGQIIVTRRIGILDGKTYKLDEEITEELYNIDIELFNGVNYIYLENITGLSMTLDYVLKNDTEDSYPTMIQMNSAITQTASEIQLNVNKKLTDYATVENLSTVKNTADSAAVMARGAQNTANGAAQRAVNVQSDLRDNYSTTVEMNSAISVSAENIMSVVSTKVGENEIISKINQTSEQISIEASKIALEGYTTINNGFSIDNNGNASIANGSVIIDNTGIKMADNTQIIGGQGLMTNLFFPSESPFGYEDMVTVNYERTDFDQPGIWTSIDLKINYFIPENFTPVKATITIVAKPVLWTYLLHNSSTGQDTSYTEWGYLRGLGIFKETSSPTYEAYYYSSSYGETSQNYYQLTQIFGNSDSWTPQQPTDTSHDVQTKVSNNLNLSYFEENTNSSFKIQMTDFPSEKPTGTDIQNIVLPLEVRRSGLAKAYLNVYGFMAFE